MLWDWINNLWDTLTNHWVWFSVAGVSAVLVGSVAAYKFAYKSRDNDAISDEQDGWIPTGRIDFSNSQSTGIFILRAEDCRIVDSSVGHREVRWRTATLDEAKSVVVAYHAQRNLAMAADYVVSTPTKMQLNSAIEDVHQKAQRLKDEASKDEASNGNPL